MFLEYALLDIGFGFKVALNEVFAVMPMDIYSVRELYLSLLKNGQIYRATRGRKGRSLIMLHNGKAFVSTLTTEQLNDKVAEYRWLKRGVESAEETRAKEKSTSTD